MIDEAMASRLANFRPLVSELHSALKAFQDSGRRFKILKTIHPSNQFPQDPINAPLEADSPRTLFILDSSFNPPTIAHKSIAQSALRKTESDAFPTPHRLLLLFATLNADKAAAPASSEQRLTLMSVFATDLIESLNASHDEYSAVPIDIGVTTDPYYTDKSAAIETEGREWYPTQPKHIHLVGFDTLKRLFATKYYPKYDPPFSALNPYFDVGHRLRVTLRPDDDFGNVDEQKAFLQKIADGEFEKDGAKREWAKQIELVPPSPKVGVSSTKIRRAAQAGKWDELAELTTPSVAAWVRHEMLYEGDESAKMA
jgi:nicotinamide-nucleotide adenylyltransferase